MMINGDRRDVVRPVFGRYLAGVDDGFVLVVVAMAAAIAIPLDVIACRLCSLEGEMEKKNGHDYF